EQEDIIRLLANELLVNAFFHRPEIDPDRTATIVLPKSIPIQLSRNEKSILLRVEDYNGGFAYDKLLGSLSRGFKEKKPRHDTGGAGLGFYFVFKMANQVIVNIKETGTEIICMFDANKRYKEYMKRVSSLHYFKGNK
ncbi:MAG: ATP-binding protein, partial [Bacteriovoracaceae bacterium]|nr:ATP-binding protein [Bacteriovoracaceae bacterium]